LAALEYTLTMSYNVSLNSKEQRAVLALALTFAARLLGLFMLLPVFALVVENYPLANKHLAGVAAGIYGLPQAILQVPFGLLSDRYGRKPVIILGLLLLAGGSLIAANATTIYGIIGGRLLQGTGAIGSVISASLADNTRDVVRTRAMAYLGMAVGGSFLLAMVLGPALEVWLGLSYMFVVAAALSIVAMLIIYKLVPAEHSLPSKLTSSTSLKLAVKKIFSRHLFSFYLGIFVLHFILSGLFLVLPFKIEAIGIVGLELSYLYLIILVIAMVCALKLIKLAENFNKILVLQNFAIIGVLTSLCLLTLVSKNFYGIILALSLFFIAFCILEASLPTLVSKTIDLEIRGAALGLFSSFQFLGIFLGGSIGGRINAIYGELALLCGCVALSFLWLLCTKIITLTNKQSIR